MSMNKTQKTILLLSILILASCASAKTVDLAGLPVHQSSKLPGIQFVPLLTEDTAMAKDIYIGWIYLAPNTTVPLHTHPSSQEKIILIEGAASLLGPDQETSFNEGDSISIAPKQPHGIKTGRKAVILFQQYDPAIDGMRIYRFPELGGDHHAR
jgi:hypothetical protein